MSSYISLTGSIQVAPQTVTDPSTTYPLAVSSSQLTLAPAAKPANVTTGFQSANVNSPAAFVPLAGVGALAAVTQGNTLYLRSRQLMQVQLTFNNPAGGTTVAVVPVNGTTIMEIDPTSYLVGIAVQGVGLVEWLVTGNQ
jgi:hypothetical protein